MRDFPDINVRHVTVTIIRLIAAETRDNRLNGIVYLLVTDLTAFCQHC